MIELRPGDVLLYDGKGFLAWAIKTKTWSDVSHAEIYLGNDVTATAKLSLGVNCYAFTKENLKYVYRPKCKFDLDSALDWFMKPEIQSQGYDTVGLLLSFYARLQGRANNKMFCSEVCTRVLRYGGIEPFSPEIDADAVAPSNFKYTPELRLVYRG